MNLKNYLNSAIRRFEKVQQLLNARASDVQLHYSDQDQRTSQESVVQNISTLNFIKDILLEARKKSFDEIRGLKKLNSSEQRGLSILRILRIQSHLAVSWSIYDQICNMILRLCGHPHITANQEVSLISPTILKFFNQDKKIYIGRIVPSLLYKHGVPIRLGYVLRNKFLHEAGGNHDLFRPTAINENALALDDEKFLNLSSKDECKATMKNPDGWPWKDDDNIIHLDNFLQQANQHSDAAHGVLLNWVVDGFSKEIELVLKV